MISRSYFELWFYWWDIKMLIRSELEQGMSNLGSTAVTPLSRAISVLFILMLLDTYSINLAGFNVKLYHVYLVMLIGISILIALYRKSLIISFDVTFIILLMYLTYHTCYITTLPDFSMNRLILMFFFFIAYTYISNIDISAGFIMKWLSISGVIVLMVALMQLIIKYGLGVEIALFMEGRPQAFFTEPDWMGYFYLLTLPYSLYFIERQNKYTLFILNLFGLLLSQARAAWVGAAIVLALYYLFSSIKIKKKYTIVFQVIIWSVVLLFIISFLIPNNPILSQFSERLVNVVNPEHGTARYRLLILELTFELFEGHWLLGTGLDSFGTYFVQYTGMNYGIHTGLWNMYVNLFIETGIVGLLLFGCFVTANLVRKLVYYFRTKDEFIKFNLLSIIMMLVANNFSNGFYFLFFWVNLAIGNYVLRSLKRGNEFGRYHQQDTKVKKLAGGGNT